LRVTLASQVAIEARLLRAPAGGRPARIKAPGGVRLEGVVGNADEGLCLPVVLNDPECSVGALQAGTPVHVTLDDAYDQIAFYTTIGQVSEDATLRLRFPAVVQIQEHRMELREPLQDDKGVRVHINDDGRPLALRVVDVSRRGLSFRYLAGELVLKVGRAFTAYLLAPGMVPCRAQIVVTNVRSDPGQRGFKIAGVRLVRPPPHLVSWLAEARHKVDISAA